jgi:hypothetical protein
MMKLINSLFIAMALCTLPMGMQAQNPYLPPTAFIPDGEPHVFTYNGEERVYVYGSRDEMVTSFCGKGHDVWSAPVGDLTRWTNHGEVFNVQQIMDMGYGVVPGQVLFAPDCVYNPVTRKYYLYVFLGTPYKLDGKAGPAMENSAAGPCYQDWGPTTFVAESDSPTGPFVNPQPCDWPTQTMSGAFDPAVLVDAQPDGSVRVYAYFGNIQPNSWWAELDPEDMHTIINRQTRMPDRNQTYHILNNPTVNHNSTVFEASSIRKIAPGVYVYICSAIEKLSALTYFYSDSPEGPWNYGGRIVDNSLMWNGGNDHGSIAQCDGKWYVFYHRRTTDDYNRQGCIEPIQLSVDHGKVVIPSVEMTSQGVQTAGLDAYRRYWAGTICVLNQNQTHVDGASRQSDGMNPVLIGGHNPYVGWKYFNFADGAADLRLKMNVKSSVPVNGEVKIAEPGDADNPGKWISVAKFQIQPGGDYSDQSFDIPAEVKGCKAVYLTFEGEGQPLCSLREIEFCKGNAPTANPLLAVNLKQVKHGMMTAIPAKAREGQCVKIEVKSSEGYRPVGIVATDAAGRRQNIQRNCITKYGPVSYRVMMPHGGLTVSASYGKGEIVRPVDAVAAVDSAYFLGKWHIASDNDFFKADMDVVFTRADGKLQLDVTKSSLPQLHFNTLVENPGRSVTFSADAGVYRMSVTLNKFKHDLASGFIMSRFACHATRVK